MLFAAIDIHKHAFSRRRCSIRSRVSGGGAFLGRSRVPRPLFAQLVAWLDQDEDALRLLLETRSAS